MKLNKQKLAACTLASMVLLPGLVNSGAASAVAQKGGGPAQTCSAPGEYHNLGKKVGKLNKWAKNGLNCGLKALGKPGVKKGFWGFRFDTLPDHPNGQAVDIMVSKLGVCPKDIQKRRGDGVAQFYANNARSLGVAYIIWDNKIWNFGNPTYHKKDVKRTYVSQWRKFSSGGSCTSQHKDHVHVSFVGENTSIGGGWSWKYYR